MNNYRHEYKYMIDARQEALLKIKASALMRKDMHALPDGSYRITSLYFDDYIDSCFHENERGTDPRSKFRIRYYNNDFEHLKLEKKSKLRGMTHKESCSITKEQCQLFMKGEIPLVTSETDEGAVKLFTEMQIRKLQPKVIVSYERTPYIYEAGNVRITFDNDIMSSNDIAGFLSEQYTNRPIMEKGMSILEVKWDALLPSHIQKNMQLDSLQWTAFSKYYMCRKYSLNGGIR